MGRLIDADALISKYGEWYVEEGTEEGFIGTVKQLADTLPSVDVPGTNVGKWIPWSEWPLRDDESGDDILITFSGKADYCSYDRAIGIGNYCGEGWLVH